MDMIVRAVIGIILVMLFVVFLMPLLPSPFGTLILILVIVLALAYLWKSSGATWPF